MRNHTGWSAAALALTTLMLTAGCGVPGEMLDERVLLRPNGDVLAAGDEVRIQDSVPGDAMAAGGTILFDGVVGGSYVGAAGEQDVRGRIDGSVRAAGGTVRIGAEVGRNVTVAGGTLELEPMSRVGGNAYLAGGSVLLDGAVDGALYVGAGEVVLDGVVGGDVRVEAERLTLGPNARLGGDLRFRTEGGVADIDAAAQVAGATEALAPREDTGPGAGLIFAVLRILAFLVTGTVLVALFPGALRELESRLGERVGASLGFGALAVLAVPLAVVLVAVTLVGLPVAAIAAVLFGVLLYLAPVVPAVWLGDALLGDHEPSVRSEALKRFLVGGPIVAIAMLVPFAGFLVRLVVVALGVGAVALTLFASNPKPETIP